MVNKFVSIEHKAWVLSAEEKNLVRRTLRLLLKDFSSFFICFLVVVYTLSILFVFG